MSKSLSPQAAPRLVLVAIAVMVSLLRYHFAAQFSARAAPPSQVSELAMALAKYHCSQLASLSNNRTLLLGVEAAKKAIPAG